MNNAQIIELAERAAPSWTSRAERNELIELARMVPENGTIVEVGGLYGGTTAVIGLANPHCEIYVVDNFSWSPLEDRPPASASRLLENVRFVGVLNVTVMEGDSRKLGLGWKKPIDLLWIDGGHSYEFVKSDLDKFGPHAKRIALHDWDNPVWPTIRKAVEDFINANPEWRVARSVEMVVVLERR